MKFDDMLSFSKKNKAMTSLLGNMFKKGLDKDHSHGVELPKDGKGNESDNEDDEGSVGSTSVAENLGEIEIGQTDPESLPLSSDDQNNLQSNNLEFDSHEHIENASQIGSSRRSSVRGNGKGAVLDDNSSLGSSKKKYMKRYRDDSDDESVNISESVSQSVDEDGSFAMKSSRDESQDVEDNDYQKNRSNDPPSNELELNISLKENHETNAFGATSIEERHDTSEIETSQTLNVVANNSMPATTKDDDEDDDNEIVEVDDELAAKLRQQSNIANALEEIATGEEAPVILEEEPKEESDEESEPGDVWDYATALDGQDYSPYRCLVCVPETLIKSPDVRLSILI
jgi:hypothetical protein